MDRTLEHTTGVQAMPPEAAVPPSRPPERGLLLFEALLDGYQDKVFRLAWSMLGDESTAKDITQEVFLKVWKSLPSYREGSSASSWIYTITRNTCLTALRKARIRRQVSLADQEIEAEVDRLAAADPQPVAGRASDVQTMLAALPVHYRRVLVLFYLEQKSYEEVAAMLAVPLGTVKTYLHRARKELARLHGSGKEKYAELEQPAAALPRA